MASKRTQKNESYRKPRRMAGVRHALAEQLELLANRRASDFTHEVNRAVLEMLEREGLWPPKPPADQK